MCCCSIVGNPLICATGSEPDCYGTQLMPMSMNLNSSQSMEIRILTLLNVHFSSPFSITFSIPSTWVNLLVWPQFLLLRQLLHQAELEVTNYPLYLAWVWDVSPSSFLYLDYFYGGGKDAINRCSSMLRVCDPNIKLDSYYIWNGCMIPWIHSLFTWNLRAAPRGSFTRKLEEIPI